MSRIDEQARSTVAMRASSVVLLAVFCFHLSRFYISVEACQHHRQDANVWQHCKDIPGWLTGYRVPLGNLTALAAEPALEPIRLAAFAPADPTHDIPLPPPFHPPRNLS